MVYRQHTPDTTFQQADEATKATFALAIRRSLKSKNKDSLRGPRAFHKLFAFQLLKGGIHGSGFMAHETCDLARAGQSHTVTVHEGKYIEFTERGNAEAFEATLD